jgi:hypothetical protein
LAIRIAANFAGLQGKRRRVIADLAGEIRMRYGSDEVNAMKPVLERTGCWRHLASG